MYVCNAMGSREQSSPVTTHVDELNLAQSYSINALINFQGLFPIHRTGYSISSDLLCIRKQ